MSSLVAQTVQNLPATQETRGGGGGGGFCGGISCCRVWALGHVGSVAVVPGPEHRLTSCGPQAKLLQGMRDLPRPGMGPRISCIGRRTLLLSHQRSPIPVTSDHTSPLSDHETLKREVTSSPPLNVPMRIRDTFVE